MSSAAARRNIRPNPSARPHHMGDSNRMSAPLAGPTEYHKPRAQDVEIDGVYKNPTFTFHLTTLVGCTVDVLVQNGKRYEGIFKTFSANLEVVLECVHLVVPGKRDYLPPKTGLIDKLILNFDDLVHMVAVNADTRYGETDSFTDSAISKAQVNGMSRTRELTPYVMDSSDGTQDGSLEELDSRGGWNPNDMFKHHDEKFGGSSSFNEENYTTKLPSSDSPGFQQKKAEADRIAALIEQDSTSRRNAELENGDGRDEEARYSAVSRSSVQPMNRHPPSSARSRDKMAHSNKGLSQSMRINGRDAHPRPLPEKQKPVSSPTSANEQEKLKKLKNWNNNFKMTASSTAGSATPPADPQSASLESKTDSVRPAVRTPAQSPVQSPVHSKVAATSQVSVTTKADAVTDPPSSPGSGVSAEPPSADQTAPSTPDVEKKETKVVKSTLNPEAKEFVCSLKPPTAVPVASLPPSQQTQQPLPAAPQQQSQQLSQQAPYKPANKTATVSVIQDARTPNKNADMPPPMLTAQQVMGSPLTHTAYPYVVMQPQPGQRMPRVPYPGNDSQPGPPHSMQPFLPAVANTPMFAAQQQMGPMPHTQHSQSGHLSQAMIAQSGHPPPGVVPPTGAATQPLHSQAPAFNAGAGYHYVPTQGGQQAPAQPPLQPSPHNPSPSPAPMQGSNPPAYNFPPPASQQFFSAPVGHHAVSQAPPYPHQQVVYIHPTGPVPGQFPAQMYQHPTYPMSGYPPSFTGHQ